MGEPTPAADEGTKLTIKERIERTRASDRKRSTRKLLYVFLPLAIILVLLIVFWNSVAFLWISLNIKFGDQETRISSLKVLVERRDKRGRPHFIAALDGNIFERNVGLKGLRFTGDSSLCNKFISIYEDKNDTYKDPVTGITNREIAVELLHQYGGSNYMAFFLSLLSRGNPWWGYGREYILEHADASLLEKLLEMLDSEEPEVRDRAVKAAFWLRDKDWIKNSEKLVSRTAGLCEDPEVRVRMWACKIVTALAGEKHLQLLLDRLRDGNEKNVVKQFAAEALGDLGKIEAVPELVRLMRTSDYPASSSAQIALIKIGSLTAVPGLIDVARDEKLERESRIGALHVMPRLVEKDGRAALELSEVQWALISIIRSADPDSPVESDANLAVRIEAAKLVSCSLLGSSSEPLRILPPVDVLTRIARAWTDESIRKAVFEAFTEESNRTIKGMLGLSLARISHPGLGRYLVRWAPNAHPSERRIIADIFCCLTATSGRPDGDDFGFADARTREEVLESAKKAEEWLDYRTSTGE